MKVCGGLSDEFKEEQRRNEEIDKDIKKDRELGRKDIKMLLLENAKDVLSQIRSMLTCPGSGESGKSTILKQMALINGKSFTEAEKTVFKEAIFVNILLSMRAILDAMPILGILLENDVSKECKTLIMAVNVRKLTNNMPPNVTEALKTLWEDKSILNCYERASEYQLTDSTKYFFDAIDRIGIIDYDPTEQDILRSRIKTVGIVESTFLVKEMTYRMYDVGGQRSERKKWLHCFENVTAVVFMTAISEYDQVLLEDSTVNRMTDSLTLFESICNSKWFVDTSMILFLNKVDLFKAKIGKSSLDKYFPDYKGLNEFEPASQFLVQKFSSLNENPAKHIFTHLTCATDTTNVKFVMGAVHEIIVKASLKKAGIFE